MSDKRYIFENYLNVARGFVSEKEYSKALQFYNKAYRFHEGKNDIELVLDIALLYDKLGYKNEAEEKYKAAIKIDKKDARAEEVVNMTFDLFCELNATDEQLDFPILYGIAREGIIMD